MNFGICELGYIPMRSGMSHKSEMVSQVLFGEIFEIVSKRGEWLKIKLTHDNYEGFVEESSITYLNENEYIEFSDNLKLSFVCHELSNTLRKNDKTNIVVPIGSKLPEYSMENKSFRIRDNIYTVETKLPEFTDKRTYAINKARSLLNMPYLWGGRTGWGIDCSGFSQLIYKLIDIDIPRDSAHQVTLGNTLNFVLEAKPGDLAFFDNEEGEIIHVGIILDNSNIIHASKFVRIDTIDHQGIYNKSLKKYTHNLRVIKSII